MPPIRLSGPGHHPPIMPHSALRMQHHILLVSGYPAATALRTTTASSCYLFTQHLQIILQQGSYPTQCTCGTMLLLLHATVQDAGLRCIRACHAGVYATGWHHLYEMPAPYKLACTHWRQTHWCRQAGVDSLSSAHGSREARQRQAFLLGYKHTHNTGSSHTFRNLFLTSVFPLVHQPYASDHST